MLGLALAALPARALDDESPSLWQERYFFDALLTARDRLSRSQSDPALLAVMKTIASQVAQQVANLQQIQIYVKSQQDNLRYAFNQPDPKESLTTIEANVDTLTQGTDQIRNNLYYLTVRCRIASSQALPDPQMYQAGLLILGQVQQLQLELNTLYTETTAVQTQVLENQWGGNKFFTHKMNELMRNVVRIQDSVFAVYNAALELSLRSK